MAEPHGALLCLCTSLVSPMSLVMCHHDMRGRGGAMARYAMQWFVYEGDWHLCHLCHLCRPCHHDMEGGGRRGRWHGTQCNGSCARVIGTCVTCVTCVTCAGRATMTWRGGRGGHRKVCHGTCGDMGKLQRPPPTTSCKRRWTHAASRLGKGFSMAPRAVLPRCVLSMTCGPFRILMSVPCLAASQWQDAPLLPCSKQPRALTNFLGATYNHNPHLSAFSIALPSPDVDDLLEGLEEQLPDKVGQRHNYGVVAPDGALNIHSGKGKKSQHYHTRLVEKEDMHMHRQCLHGAWSFLIRKWY